MKLIIIIVFNFLLFKFRSLIFFYLIFLVVSWMRNNLSSSKIVVIKKALTNINAYPEGNGNPNAGVTLSLMVETHIQEQRASARCD